MNRFDCSLVTRKIHRRLFKNIVGVVSDKQIRPINFCLPAKREDSGTPSALFRFPRLFRAKIDGVSFDFIVSTIACRYNKKEGFFGFEELSKLRDRERKSEKFCTKTPLSTNENFFG